MGESHQKFLEHLPRSDRVRILDTVRLGSCLRHDKSATLNFVVYPFGCYGIGCTNGVHERFQLDVDERGDHARFWFSATWRRVSPERLAIHSLRER
jgi:hypothetical protein